MTMKNLERVWSRLSDCQREVLIVLIDTMLVMEHKQGAIRLNNAEKENIKGRIDHLIISELNK